MNSLGKSLIPVSSVHLTRSQKPVIVLFFAHGCYWCDKLRPEWDNFANNSPIDYSEVSSDEMVNYTPSPKEDRVKGYPTIRLYNKGTLVKEYDGDRSQQDILKFVKKYVKENKAKKNNLLLVRARKGNNINKKLIHKITKQKSKGKGTGKGTGKGKGKGTGTGKGKGTGNGTGKGKGKGTGLSKKNSTKKAKKQSSK